jgi:hypothetical protein
MVEEGWERAGRGLGKDELEKDGPEKGWKRVGKGLEKDWKRTGWNEASLGYAIR